MNTQDQKRMQRILDGLVTQINETLKGFAEFVKARTATVPAKAQTGFVPTYAHEGDAGADLYSTQYVTIYPGETLTVDVGVSVALPVGTVALVCSRSGMARKSSIHVLNSPGIIDQGYRDNLGAILHNSGTEPFVISRGDRIAQLVILPFVRAEFVAVEELPESERGKGGFGSSGK